MPYYAVSSGDIFRCVLADDMTSACVVAVTQHLGDDFTTDCLPGRIFAVAEFGVSSAEHAYVHRDDVMLAGNFETKEV